MKATVAAALPPDVRKGSAFPIGGFLSFLRSTLCLESARLSLADISNAIKAGQAKPDRTSSGKAAERPL